MFSDLEIRKMFDFMLKTFISNHKKSTGVVSIKFSLFLGDFHGVAHVV